VVGTFVNESFDVCEDPDDAFLNVVVGTSVRVDAALGEDPIALLIVVGIVEGTIDFYG